MKFQLGDIICADGEQYRVAGRITYQNMTDHCDWDEYRLLNTDTGEERWLSIDDTYQEYSIWKMERFCPDLSGYHQSDQGMEVVVSYEGGGLDVDRGERANFVEYEDPTEELLISQEQWSDGMEYASGCYLDEDEIWLVRSDPGFKAKQNAKGYLAIVIMILAFLIPSLGGLLEGVDFHITPTVQKYVGKTNHYTYVTSITGNEKQKAKVYSSDLTLDMTAKDIIAGIEGNTEYVQKDDEETEGAIAILTPKEYCLIYQSLEGQVLVQISSRKYAYTTDDDPYHSTQLTRRYYRRFYRSTGYSGDSASYHNYSSPYSSYDGESFSYSSGNSYESYSSSIRQSSIEARQSSGGGLSSGK